MRSRAIPFPDYPEPQPRSEVKSAFDPDMPTYGDPMPDKQHVDGLSFADLRDEMSARRRRTARRMNDCDY